MASAQVLSVERSTDDDGTPVTIVKVDLGGGDVITAELALAPGDDSPPLPGDVASTVDDGGTGTEFAAGFQDTKNAGAAQLGEKRFYGRDSNGKQVCEIWLKGEGTVRCSNGKGFFELGGADGTIDLNGFKIDSSGNATGPGTISANGEVTAMAQGPGVKLSTHTHPTAMAPSGPPTPGT